MPCPWCWRRCRYLGLGIFGPGIANGIVSGGPQLGAGAAVGTGLAAGGIVAAGAAGAAMGAGAAGTVLAGAARGGASVAAGASAAYRAGGMTVSRKRRLGDRKPAASRGGQRRQCGTGSFFQQVAFSGGAAGLGDANEALADRQPWRIRGNPCRPLR